MTLPGSESFPRVELADELRGKIRAGWVGAAPVAVRDSSRDLVAEMERLAQELRGRWEGLPPAGIETLRPARDLYRAFGIDPTKNRPSSEALLRRILKGHELPLISNAVDVANYLAVRLLLPIGLYDTEQVSGRVELRRGRPGEAYAGIRKKDIHLEGRPVMADEQGAFGNPTSDSARTCVGERTRSLLLVVFAPAAFPSDGLDRYVDDAVAAVRSYLDDPATVSSGRVDA